MFPALFSCQGIPPTLFLIQGIMASPLTTPLLFLPSFFTLTFLSVSPLSFGMRCDTSQSHAATRKNQVCLCYRQETTSECLADDFVGEVVFGVEG